MACCDIPRGGGGGRGRSLTANIGLLGPRSAAVNAVRVHGVGRRRPRGQPRHRAGQVRGPLRRTTLYMGAAAVHDVELTLNERATVHWKAIVVRSARLMLSTDTHVQRTV